MRSMIITDGVLRRKGEHCFVLNSGKVIQLLMQALGLMAQSLNSGYHDRRIERTRKEGRHFRTLGYYYHGSWQESRQEGYVLPWASHQFLGKALGFFFSSV